MITPTGPSDIAVNTRHLGVGGHWVHIEVRVDGGNLNQEVNNALILAIDEAFDKIRVSQLSVTIALSKRVIQVRKKS